MEPTAGRGSAFADAFVLTGDLLYAHALRTALDRVGDLCPDMDWSPFAQLGSYHSDGDSGMGKIFGRISETVVLQTLARGYDRVGWAVRREGELFEFLADQAGRYRLPTPKGDWEAFRRGVEQRVLRCGLEAVREERIRGNHGQHETAAAWAAIALGGGSETVHWLDWLFAPTGNRCRGFWSNCSIATASVRKKAPGYGWGWGNAFNMLVELLEGYGRYDRWRVYRDFPLFRRVFTAPFGHGAVEPVRADDRRLRLLHGATRAAKRLAVSAGRLPPQWRRGNRPGDRRAQRRRLRRVSAGTCSTRSRSAGPSGSLRRPGGRLAAAGPGTPPARLRAAGVGAGRCLAGTPCGSTTGATMDMVIVIGSTSAWSPSAWICFPTWVTRTSPHASMRSGRRGRTTRSATTRSSSIRCAQQPTWSGRTRFVKLLPGTRVAEVAGGGVYPQTQDYRHMNALIETPDGQAYNKHRSTTRSFSAQVITRGRY